MARGLAVYLCAVWKCRYFWLALVANDLRTRYRRSVLGIAWSLLQPLAMTAVLCMVFHVLLKQEIATFAPYVLCGMTFWNFFTTVFRDGCSSLFRSESFIRQHPAPMAIYPLRVALAAGFHFVLGMILTLALCALCLGKLPGILALAGLLPAVILMLLLGWALAVIAGVVSVYFPDVQHIVDVGLQVLFFVTPIFYPDGVLREHGLGTLMQCNPLTWLLNLLRQPILHNQLPTRLEYLVCLSIVAGMSALAVATLAKLERRLIFRM